MLRVCLALLCILSVPACQGVPVSAPLSTPQTQIAGRLILPANGQQVVLKQGTITIFSGEQQLAQATVQENRFVLPVLKVPGPYTYQGQGVVERLQQEAVPIGGSQGGAVPIGGSQGGLRPSDFATLQTPAVAAGQTVSFAGQILDDLTRALAQLDVQVPENSIQVVANQSIVNIDSEVKDSVQAVVTGSNQGPVTIVNGQTPANRPPMIREVRVTPPGPVAPGSTVTLEVDAIDPDGDILQYRWSAKRGALSSDRGRIVTWTAIDSQENLPNVTFIEVEIIDLQNNKDKSRVVIAIQR
jgi:hypothetical protein